MNHFLKLFIVKSGVLLVFWVVFFEFNLFGVADIINAFVLDNLIIINDLLLRSLGYATFIEPENLVGIVGSSGVIIGPPCNGVSLVYLYIAFFAAFPSPWKSKWLVMLGGALLIQFLNIIRILTLSILALKHPEWLDFNHDYTFTTFIYGVILLIWFIWTNRSKGLNFSKN